MRKISARKFLDSVWVFPIALTLVLLALTALKLHGSSLGYYHSLFYTNTSHDPNLVFGEPRAIRSDEYLVNTQKAIAQDEVNYSDINQNIGNGEDLTILADAPYRHWSTLFRPHNIPFLVLPFDFAFAFRWWFMAYMLILSVYFLVVTLLPGRRLLASLIAGTFLLSPFIQWWYVYGTLGTLSWAIFGILAYIKIVNADTTRRRLAWSAFLSYSGLAFALTLYPPFQIPVALVSLTFATGWTLDNLSSRPKQKKHLRTAVLCTIGAATISGLLLGAFMYQKSGAIETISSTAYPGHRIAESGGQNLKHILGGHLNFNLQDDGLAQLYRGNLGQKNNQSVDSNFIFIAFFLLPFIFFILTLYRKKKHSMSYTTLSLLSVGAVLFAWSYVYHLDILGKLTLLDKVPPARALIGLGLVNLLLLVTFMNTYSKITYKASIKTAALYSTVVFASISWLTFITILSSPGYVGILPAFIACLVLACIVYLFLRKNYIAAWLLFLAVSLASVLYIHPIYKGTETLRNTPLVNAIREIVRNSDKKWISDDRMTINFASLAGAKSLSGVYTYPQLELWRQLDPRGEKDYTYNRYAHAVFTLDRDESVFNSATMDNREAKDVLNIAIEPCDSFLAANNVGFVITKTTLNNPCVELIKKINYPNATFLIYKIAPTRP